MDDVKIILVESRAELQRFIKFPTKLYKGNKFYVHPLECDERMLFSRKNPSYDDVILAKYLAIRGNEVVGRIAVMVHKLYNEKTNGKYARFTRFDFIDDITVSRALLDTATCFAKEHGMEILHGPLGFSDFDKEGVLIEGFDKLSTFETIYNYAYYKNHLEALGFTKEADWLEFVIKVPEKPNERFDRIASKMIERLNLHFLPEKMSVREIVSRYIDDVVDIINTTYSPLHGFVPITPKLKQFIVAQFKKVFKREYICLLFNENDELVAFALGLPSIARSVNACEGRIWPFGFIKILKELRRPRYIDMALIAVLPQYRNKGLNAIMINELLKNCIKRGIVSVESNLELEDNTAVQSQFDDFDRELVKRRRCYSKSILDDLQ